MFVPLYPTMDIFSHPRIEAIRALVFAKARLDRLCRLTIWCMLAGSCALVFMKIEPLLVSGTGEQLKGGGTGTRSATLTWIGIGAPAVTLLALVMAAACAIRGARLARRFHSCLQDQTTRNVPPLDGEVVAGLLHSRTVEIPASVARSGDPAAVARIMRPRSRGKVSEIMREGSALRHALHGIPLHSLGGPVTTVGRWQIDRLYSSLSRQRGSG